MANTYSQIFIHLVFAVKYRDGVISASWRQRLHQYMVAMVQKCGHKVYAIGGMSDHVHLLVSMSSIQSVSELVLELKRASSVWINEQRLVVGKFAWQEGYGAFSYGKSQIDGVVNYIKHQEEHHRKKTFKEEYMEFLEIFGVQYDDRYVFRCLEERMDGPKSPTGNGV